MNAEGFWARVQKSDGCWLWTGARDKHEYGAVYFGKKLRKAHRVAWEITVGPIPAGHGVLHHCDNPPCVRPDHLFTGDHKANMADAIAKGRFSRPFRVKRFKHAPERTHCRSGHEFAAEAKPIRSKTGTPVCRICRNARARRYLHRKNHGERRLVSLVGSAS